MAGDVPAPIIIKRKKIIAAGHHGGAWKVAYADFVTAMMAFFLLMWLLGATNEKQRKGIAQYFSPTIPVMRVSGGGAGSFGGDSVFTKNTLANNGTGQGALANDGDAEQKMLEELELVLTAMSGESMVSDGAFRHIITRVTDKGLTVEFFDSEGEHLFEKDTDEPTQLMIELSAMIVRVFDMAVNDVAIDGFTRSRPIILIDNPVWSLSSSRAHAVRQLLSKAGMRNNRVQRVTGHADNLPSVKNPMSVRNNRVEIILLRKGV